MVSRAQRELAQQMTREAYALGRGLGTAQRVSLLTRLLYTLRPEVMAAEKKQWAGELFELAQRLPAEAATSANGWNTRNQTRNQAIATAAARLALYDSDRALELLDTLPSQHGRREDARTMAARLVFAIYMRHHGAAGAQTLLAHARKWGEDGGFPYAASTAALARLSGDEQAAEEFFRAALGVFARGPEGAYGIGEFGELLERAVAMEAISEDSAEEAGRAIVARAAKLAATNGGEVVEGEVLPEISGTEAPPGSDPRAPYPGPDPMERDSKQPASIKGVPTEGVATKPIAQPGLSLALSEEGGQRLAAALNNVRLAAPKAYAQAAKDWPGLAGLRAAHVVSPVQSLKVDAGLQASFAELAAAMRERRGPEAVREVVGRGLEHVNARYKAGACVGCVVPDAQSWALVSLAAYASPWTIGAQLKAIEEPFWRAYFLAIAAQKVGEPTRVADPTARRPIGKEEAEPEDEEDEAPE